jgi:hypothetical protein
MKQIITLSTVIVAFAIITGFATNSNAQSQNVDIQTTLSTQVTSINAPVMSQTQVDNLTRTSVSVSLREQASQFASITANSIMPSVTNGLKDIANGGTKTFAARVNAKGIKSIVNQNSIRVNVSYEPRPIGGILNVTVAYVPQFSGVGVATRAIGTKTIALAVDGLDAGSVNKLVASLSSDLATDIAQNGGNQAQNLALAD